MATSRAELVYSKRRQGFGLSEILVAIVIFVVTYFVLLGVLTASTHAVKQSQEEICATDMAEGILEGQQVLSFDSIGNFTGSANVTYQSQGATVILSFLYSVTVTPIPATSPTYKDILVNVTWTADDIKRSAALETGVAK